MEFVFADVEIFGNGYGAARSQQRQRKHARNFAKKIREINFSENSQICQVQTAKDKHWQQIRGNNAPRRENCLEVVDAKRVENAKENRQLDYLRDQVHHLKNNPVQLVNARFYYAGAFAQH